MGEIEQNPDFFCNIFKLTEKFFLFSHDLLPNISYKEALNNPNNFYKSISIKKDIEIEFLPPSEKGNFDHDILQFFKNIKNLSFHKTSWLNQKYFIILKPMDIADCFKILEEIKVETCLSQKVKNTYKYKN